VNLALLPEVIIGLGCVPLADYGLPGTPALTEPLKPYIPKYDAIMMGNHGAVCYGEDVYKAFFRMELWALARISLVRNCLAGHCVTQGGVKNYLIRDAIWREGRSAMEPAARYMPSRCPGPKILCNAEELDRDGG